MRQTFLGTDGHDGLGFGIERDGVAGLIPVADGAAQARDAARDRIAMGVSASSGFHQFLHDMGWSRLIGIAHAEIDDVLAASAGLGLQLVDDVEDVRGQAFDALKVGVHGGIPDRLNLGASGGSDGRRRQRPAEKTAIAAELTSLAV